MGEIEVLFGFLCGCAIVGGERRIVSTEKVNWICAGATGSRDQARFNIEKANFGRTEKKEKGCTLFLISSEGLHPIGCYVDYFF